METLVPTYSLAAEIAARARESDIPLRNDPALAEALATLSVGEGIPAEMLSAVAEVLAFVSRLNGPG